MKNGSGFLVFPLIVLIAGAVIWATRIPRNQNLTPATAPIPAAQTPLRIGIVPERDIFSQRRRYQILADYLTAKLNRPVQIVTANSYRAVLSDFEERQVDCAFLGSLVGQMVIDQLGGKVVLKPELADGVSTYQGIIFVPKDSPIQSVDQLRGKKVAMIRTTFAAHLFPVHRMRQLLAGSDAPGILWLGTHDEVMIEVMEGRADAGAVKSTRLLEFEHRHPQFKVRRLAESELLPDNGLVLRKDLDPAVSAQLVQVLGEMNRDESGRKALEHLGAVRFVPCTSAEYQPIRNAIKELGPIWIEQMKPDLSKPTE